MSFDLNRTELIGRVGRQPDVDFTGEGGTALARFRVATDRPTRPGASAETDWHTVVCWDRLAEFAAKHLAKGRRVFVAGRLTYRTWEGQGGQSRRTAEIVAGELILLDNRRPDAEVPRAAAAAAPDGVPDGSPDAAGV